MSNTRKRAFNWTLKESLLLLEEAFTHIHIIKGHHKDHASAEKAKSEVWEKIAAAVSSASEYQRTATESKIKFGNLLKDASKKISKYNKALKQTGETPSDLNKRTK